MSVPSIFVAVVFMTSSMMAMTTATTTTPPSPPSGCASYPPYSANSTSGFMEPVKTLMTWKVVLLMIAIGLFAIVVSVIFKRFRKWMYDDASAVSDTQFDAGGDINFALVASSVIARWLWTSSFSWSSLEVTKFGLVGHFWYAAATSVPLLLFAYAAFQLRIKAPGAKTFLQVIEKRFGKCTHIVAMVIALLVNLFIGGMIQMEAIRIISSVTQNVSPEGIGALISVLTGIFAWYGVGGDVYFSYFAVLAAVSIALTYFIDTLYNPFQRSGPAVFAAPVASTMYKATSCVVLPASTGSLNGSALTFSSSGALTDAIMILLSGIGCVFTDQSFWQAAVIADPSDAVCGFLSGGLTFFTISFVFSFVFGMSYWTISVQQGSPAVDPMTALGGLLPATISQNLLHDVGDYLMVGLTMAVTITALNSQIQSAVSIIQHDIFVTYVQRKVPVKSSTTVLTPSQPRDYATIAQVTTEESTANAVYKRDFTFSKFKLVVMATNAIFTASGVMLSLHVPLPWMFKLVGIISGSSVIPVLLSVAWYRTTSGGVLAGILSGLAAGITGWLASAAAMSGPLYAGVGQPIPSIIGLALAIGVGGLVCLVISALSGGCQKSASEQAMWELTSRIDNPASPWTVKYAAFLDICRVDKLTGLPDYKQLPKRFRWAGVRASAGGILFSGILMVIWPALMVIAGVFNEHAFTSWTSFVLAVGIIGAAYIGFVPPILELIQRCRHAQAARDIKHVQINEDEAAVAAAFGQRTMQTVNIPQLPEHHVRYAAGVQHQQPLCLPPPPPPPPVDSGPIPVLVDASGLSHCGHGGQFIQSSSNPGSNYIVVPTASTSAITSPVNNSNSAGWKASVHID